MPQSKPDDETSTANEIFEAYLTETISDLHLLEFERIYVKATAEQNITHKIHCDYAVSLIRSRYTADIQRGIMLMENLSMGHPEGNRDYYFFLSVGYARMKNYSVAIKFLSTFLDTEPGNKQMIAWRTFLKDKLKRESRIGLAFVTGSALVVGGLVGIGLQLLKR